MHDICTKSIMSYSSSFYHGPWMKTNSKFLHLSFQQQTTFRAFPCVRLPDAPGSEPSVISCGSRPQTGDSQLCLKTSHATCPKVQILWQLIHGEWLSRSGMLLKPIVNNLVGGFNPFEKYQSNWIISPGKGENKNLWNYYHCNRGWPGWLQKMYHCPKIEIEPEKHDLDDDLPLPKMHSQVPC